MSLENGSAVLSSQMITTAAVSALVNGDARKFLELRAQSIMSEIDMLCKYGYIL